MRTWANPLMVGAVAAVSFGCAQKPSVPVAVIDDKVYSVTPDKVKVTAGIVNGEITELKVMERVEQGTGRIDTAAKLSGKLKLTNSSTDQTVRLIGGKILYIDDQGQVMKLEATRALGAQVVLYDRPGGQDRDVLAAQLAAQSGAT